jgi:hypothetical protein
MVSRYLIFDESCSTCAHIAAVTQTLSKGKLQAVSIYSATANELLDTVYPQGWSHMPYLVTVSQGGVTAVTGVRMLMQLAYLIGPERVWRLWNAAKEDQITLFPRIRILSSPRRRFLKFGAISAALTGLIGLNPAISLACVPCQSCGFSKRRISCTVYEGECDSQRPDRRRVCIEYSYYDGRTGEYCYDKTECKCTTPGCPS